MISSIKRDDGSSCGIAAGILVESQFLNSSGFLRQLRAPILVVHDGIRLSR